MNTQQLVEKYIPLANKLAYQKKTSLPSFIDIDEIKSAAYLGLVEAASRFDPLRGSFSTYAYPRIMGAIQDYLRELNWCKKRQPLEDVETKPDRNCEDVFEILTMDFDTNAKAIMRHYFIDEYSMKEVGHKFGVSESRISQLIKEYKLRIIGKWSRTINELAA